MPDPRIPIVAGVLLQEWRAEFVARPFEAVAARVVGALDRAAVPAADQVEIMARAICIAGGDNPDRSTYPRSKHGDMLIQDIAIRSWQNYGAEARAAIAALSAAPRVTEISDAMVEIGAKAYHDSLAGAGAWEIESEMGREVELRAMRAALSAALAGRGGEGAPTIGGSEHLMREALERLLKRHDNYLSTDRNHSDAYYALAKHAYDDWQFARAALDNALPVAPTPPPAESVSLRPESEWHEDIGPVLWWYFDDGKLQEAPWVGTPNANGHTVEMWGPLGIIARGTVGGWPGYHTHWTPLPTPDPPLPTVEPGGF